MKQNAKNRTSSLPYYPNSNDAVVEDFIKNYRFAVLELESQTTELGREKWRVAVKRLRERWKHFQGEDSLHEMAFGEPE